MNEYYSTPSASTLHPKSRPYDDHQDAVDQAIENFQKLNSKQKERYLGMVQSMMADAGTGKGTFGPVLHAPYQNSAGVGKVIKQEEAFDWPTVADILSDDEHDTLREELAEFGFTEDALPKCVEIFRYAVNERLEHEPFVVALKELFNEYSPLVGIQDFDVVQILADRIQTLESAIEMAKAEKEELIEDIQNLAEETQRSSSPSRQIMPRRSSVNDLMCEADEDNADCLFNEHQQVRDHRMQQYLRYFGNAE